MIKEIMTQYMCCLWREEWRILAAAIFVGKEEKKSKEVGGACC
jgi:hypothetical protein